MCLDIYVGVSVWLANPSVLLLLELERMPHEIIAILT
jgi:hypothetical protein